jgi:hypothetical protein
VAPKKQALLVLQDIPRLAVKGFADRFEESRRKARETAVPTRGQPDPPWVPPQYSRRGWPRTRCHGIAKDSKSTIHVQWHYHLFCFARRHLVRMTQTDGWHFCGRSVGATRISRDCVAVRLGPKVFPSRYNFRLLAMLFAISTRYKLDSRRDAELASQVQTC